MSDAVGRIDKNGYAGVLEECRGRVTLPHIALVENDAHIECAPLGVNDGLRIGAEVKLYAWTSTWRRAELIDWTTVCVGSHPCGSGGLKQTSTSPAAAGTAQSVKASASKNIANPSRFMVLVGSSILFTSAASASSLCASSQRGAPRASTRPRFSGRPRVRVSQRILSKAFFYASLIKEMESLNLPLAIPKEFHGAHIVPVQVCLGPPWDPGPFFETHIRMHFISSLSQVNDVFRPGWRNE